MYSWLMADLAEDRINTLREQARQRSLVIAAKKARRERRHQRKAQRAAPAGDAAPRHH